jgi:DNA repair protein RadC
MKTKRKKLTDNAGTTYLAYGPPLPMCDQPFNRLVHNGPTACSLTELLQVVIGGAWAERAARDLLAHAPDLRALASMSTQELASLVHGVGAKKAAQLKACLELGKRLVLHDTALRPLIKTPADAAELLMPLLGPLEQEEVHLILLDSRNRLMAMMMVYRGTISAADIRVAEVFKEAIRRNAASIIVAHNHPSNDPSPSADDVSVTLALIRAGELLGIEVTDHLVIGAGRYVSLRERGLAFTS